MAHTHSIYDNDKHFSIDPVTRVITNESGKVVLINKDHNSERFTFEIPKEVDGHDMSRCNSAKVHYLNIEAETKIEYADVYECDDLQVSPTDRNVVICSWLLSRNATQYVGPLHFVVRFSCVEDGTEEYAWSTAIHSSVSVSDGIHNATAVVGEYSDVLEKWKNELVLANIVKQYTPADARAELQVDNLHFTNTVVSYNDFQPDTTYPQYPYRATVPLLGVDNTRVPEVILSLEDAISEIYAPVAESYDGGIYLYAVTPPDELIMIPTIICWRGTDPWQLEE